MKTTDPRPAYTKIVGYVGRMEVTAFVYGGADADLSHYTANGQTKVGTVQFTSISNQTSILY